jgi:uncharacterized protein
VRRVALLSDEDIAQSLRVLEHARRAAPLVHSTIHGERHWQTVARIGLHLAGLTHGAALRVTGLFAILHDACRENENYDPEHGRRAARLVDELAAAGELELPGDELMRLRDAVARHNDGETSLDPVIGVCWDADRLCLPRVGIEPRDELLSTPVARAIRGWARSVIDEPLSEWRPVLALQATPAHEGRNSRTSRAPRHQRPSRSG